MTEQYDISDAVACQYWRDFRKNVCSIPEFVGVANPIDILSKIDGLMKLVAEKDNIIEKLQKRNDSLTDILADALNKSKNSEKSDSSSREYSLLNRETSEPAEQQNEVKNLQSKYQLAVDQKNTIYGHWKTVSDHRDTYKNKYESAQAKCEELKQMLATCPTGEPSNIVTVGVKGDKDIILKRDANGRCGIKFGCLRKPPLLMESNTVIANVKPGLQNASEISIGDFVIEINQTNVQQLPNDDVLQLVKDSSLGDLKLKLRPSKHDIQYTTRSITGNKSTNEWGMVLGVFVKESKNGMYACKQGINEMDELIKVNSKQVYDLSLKSIYNYMNKEVKIEIKHQTNPYDLYETFSSRSSVISGTSDHSERGARLALPSTPSFDTNNDTPPSPPPGRYRPPLFRDDASVSSGSSSKRGSFCEEGTLRRDKGLSSSQLLNNTSLSDLTGQFSGGSDPFGSGNSGNSGGESKTDSDIKKYIVKKHEYESFGWTFIGGNKVGIYIKAIDNWSPIEKAGIGVGWKILSVDDVKLEDVAFSFANDFMSSLRNKTSINVKLQSISRDTYSSQVSKQPKDTFRIRAITDYKKKSADETSFKSGDMFRVTDSYYVDGTTNLKWVAVNDNTGQSVVIPSQKSRFLINEDEANYKRRNSKHVTARYYEILDKVDVKYSMKDEEDEGAF